MDTPRIIAIRGCQPVKQKKPGHSFRLLPTQDLDNRELGQTRARPDWSPPSPGQSKMIQNSSVRITHRVWLNKRSLQGRR